MVMPIIHDWSYDRIFAVMYSRQQITIECDVQ